jgi:2-polyprenyl-3-methyl-5-hydroxy-6-metoxy-1,4-benzoquinol methylase
MTDHGICPVCGGQRFVVTGQITGENIVRCLVCRLELLSSVLSKSQIARRQAGQASATETSGEYKEAMITRFQSLRESILRIASNRLELYSGHLGRKPANILEVGSGAGGMIKAFQELGVQSVGLENDPDLVSVAQKNGANVQWADVCELNPVHYSRYDVVCSSQTIEHILFPHAALANMKNLAHPGGLIHLDVPNSAGWGARLRRLHRGNKRWGMLEPPHHQIGYYPVTLRRLLESSGLEIIQIIEKPTNDRVFGQAILPTAFLSRAAVSFSKWLGHGYLLVGLARVPSA